jgi:hypothetical protein
MMREPAARVFPQIFDAMRIALGFSNGLAGSWLSIM